jgi:hypothetical protein
MSNIGCAAKDAAAMHSVKEVDITHAKTKAKDRNKFFTSGMCSCIVPDLTSFDREQKEEPKNSIEDSKAMDIINTNMAEEEAANEMARYLAHIAHLDMPLSAKIEMVSALRLIMASFVDSAFGDDPVQHVHEMRARDEVRQSAVLGSDDTQFQKDDTDLSSAFASPAAGGEKKERP